MAKKDLEVSLIFTINLNEAKMLEKYYDEYLNSSENIIEFADKIATLLFKKRLRCFTCSFMTISDRKDYKKFKRGIKKRWKNE